MDDKRVERDCFSKVIINASRSSTCSFGSEVAIPWAKGHPVCPLACAWQWNAYRLYPVYLGRRSALPRNILIPVCSHSHHIRTDIHSYLRHSGSQSFVVLPYKTWRSLRVLASVKRDMLASAVDSPCPKRTLNLMYTFCVGSCFGH